MGIIETLFARTAAAQEAIQLLLVCPAADVTVEDLQWLEGLLANVRQARQAVVEAWRRGEEVDMRPTLTAQLDQLDAAREALAERMRRHITGGE